MRERTLSLLIMFSFVLGVACYVIGHGDFVADLEIKSAARYMVMLSFAVTPILMMSKIFSRLSLHIFCDMQTSTLEGIFSIYYFFLTKEAREEWRTFIDERRKS